MEVGGEGNYIPIATLSPAEWLLTKVGSDESHFNVSLTPSLPQPVKIKCLGWNIHGNTFKTYIFQSFNPSIFNAMRFDENAFKYRYQCEKRRQKGLKVLILPFYWLFLNNIMALKGLIVRDKVTRQYPQTTTFEEKGELRQIWTKVPLLTSLTPYRLAKLAPTQDDDSDGSSTTDRGRDRQGGGRERERKKRWRDRALT